MLRVTLKFKECKHNKSIKFLMSENLNHHVIIVGIYIKQHSIQV